MSKRRRPVRRWTTLRPGTDSEFHRFRTFDRLVLAIDRYKGQPAAERSLNAASDKIAAMNHLRHISVFVDEPVPGHFHWVLHEGSPFSVWIESADSEQSYTSWTEAFEAGTVALYRMVLAERVEKMRRSGSMSSMTGFKCSGRSQAETRRNRPTPEASTTACAAQPPSRA